MMRDTVRLGQSYVLAAVFGGGRHYRHLQQTAVFYYLDYLAVIILFMTLGYLFIKLIAKTEKRDA